jgi:hypothetical protein
MAWSSKVCIPEMGTSLNNQSDKTKNGPDDIAVAEQVDLGRTITDIPKPVGKGWNFIAEEAILDKLKYESMDRCANGIFYAPEWAGGQVKVGSIIPFWLEPHWEIYPGLDPTGSYIDHSKKRDQALAWLDFGSMVCKDGKAVPEISSQKEERGSLVRAQVLETRLLLLGKLPEDHSRDEGVDALRSKVVELLERHTTPQTTDKRDELRDSRQVHVDNETHDQACGPLEDYALSIDRLTDYLRQLQANHDNVLRSKPLLQRMQDQLQKDAADLDIEDLGKSLERFQQVRGECKSTTETLAKVFQHLSNASHEDLEFQIQLRVVKTLVEDKDANFDADILTRILGTLHVLESTYPMDTSTSIKALRECRQILMGYEDPRRDILRQHKKAIENFYKKRESRLQRTDDRRDTAMYLVTGIKVAKGFRYDWFGPNVPRIWKVSQLTLKDRGQGSVWRETGTVLAYKARRIVGNNLRTGERALHSAGRRKLGENSLWTHFDSLRFGGRLLANRTRNWTSQGYALKARRKENGDEDDDDESEEEWRERR